MFEHDFKKYPELTNTEINDLGFTSPFPQIVEDFDATVVKVHDGDTVTLRIPERDFDFPMRFLSVDAPELSQPGGKETGDWLRDMIEGRDVRIKIDKNNRVEKYGRLLGDVIFQGLNIGEMEVMQGRAWVFINRHEAEIPNFDKLMTEGEI